MREKKLLLLLSQSFLGTGFFFLYVFHVRSVFESRTNIAHEEQLERESLLRNEDALYYSFYKTITEQRDFWTGYEKLRNVSDIEYPNSVNVLQRFNVLPELSISYLYHLWRYYTKDSNFPFLSCWQNQDMRHPLELQDCDMSGQAMQFYLEFVWILGGLTVSIIYLYGTLLSHNVFGGVYAVVSYSMFHSCYASKIYNRPVARENFAFPFILFQMFHLCLQMNRVGSKKVHSSRIVFICMQTLITTIALLCWQFSSVIFASQLLIMMTPWNFNPNMPKVLSSLTIDYSISQLVANALCFYCSLGNKKYAFAWQLGPAVGLLSMSLKRRKMPETSQDKTQSQSLKSMALGVFLAASAQSSFTDLLDKTGLTRAVDNTYALYRDLIIHWSLRAKISFNTSLAACNSAYERMIWTDLWELIATLIVKPYCLYGVVMLAKFFRKWRKKGENKNLTEEYQERMKKYVLEDFLESYHVSMSVLSNKETEDELNECLKLLSECNYDYEKYKEKKSQQSESNHNEHVEFMNDIKNLKKRISDLNKMSKKENKDTAQISEPNEKSDEDDLTKEKPSKQQKQTAKLKKTAQSDATNKTTTSASSGFSCSKSNGSVIVPDSEDCGFQYIYSLIQMIVFTVVGLCIKKLFFLSFTLGCIIVPTICLKLCFRNQRDIFWIISLNVFLTSIVNPGFANIREEYFSSQSPYGNDDLDTMLQWIKMNTERDAVFAGPIGIIGTVHLTTKRPIVNHAHLEMREISERTEYVYSVFSRQQSSDIYNQCSQLKIQYLIISLKDCSNEAREDCDLLSIWDDMQPAYRKYPQFCSELATKNIPSFLKVFSNEYFTIVKMFSQSVQINLKSIRILSNIPEMAI